MPNRRRVLRATGSAEEYRNYVPSPKPKKPKRPRKKLRNSQLFRLLAALAGIIGVLVLFTALPSIIDMQGTPVPAEEYIPETPVPEPTDPVDEYGFPAATPTPAQYAPLGAQYGYGGADLIPTATPTSVPDTAEPMPEPTPTPVPTEAPTAAPAALRKGSKGDEVSRMQTALIGLGYLTGMADGDFGSGTESAVRMFQAVNGLSADGIAGTKTLALLYSGNALPASAAPEMDYLILVNREYKLDSSYTPSDLVTIESILPSSLVKVKYEGTTANRTAIEALGEMLRAAAEDGITDFQVSSAFRTYKQQQKLVDNSVASYMKNNPTWSKKTALSATYNTVAPAGTSEHQTGLAFDMTVPGKSFTGTAQQKWLRKHCSEYGFVERFTESKQKKTGFIAESWHFRYVGKEVAAILTANDWCLEEYYEKMGLEVKH